jgi:nucleoside-diphosphate-sugar epimerase
LEAYIRYSRCSGGVHARCQADSSISGVFNVTSGNYTVGQVADLGRDELKKLTGTNIKLTIRDIQDFRNYKVTWEKAQTVLGFMPKYGITEIIHSLYDNLPEYGDLNQTKYFNITTFKNLNL